MSQAVSHAGLVYTSGQVHEGPDVASQTRAILEKIDGLLERSGSSKRNILTANIWLSDMSTFGELNDVWDAWVDTSNPPARATVQSVLAAPDYLVEISVIAAVEGDQ